MDKEKRRGDEPIPHNINELLNEAQRIALRQLESYGWQLKFIRRPLFQERVAVVVNPDGEKFGILEEDGRINMDLDIIIR